MPTTLRLLLILILCLNLQLPTLAEGASPAIHCQPAAGCSYTQTENTVLQLENGEFLLSINKPDKNPAFICSESLQIRCQQARLRIVNNGPNCTVAVLDGKITIKNLLDHSILRLSRGIVYEAVAIAAAPSGQPIKQDCSYRDMRNTAARLPLFLSQKMQVCLYALKQDQEQAICWSHHAAIICAPCKCQYAMGAEAIACLPLPASIAHNFPPSGLINPAALKLQTELLAAGQPQSH